MHRELAAYYVGLAPSHFRMPDLEGLAAELDRDLETEDEEMLHLVAEVDGEVVSALLARLLPPVEGARREIDPDAGEPRLRIEYLVTDETHRNQGLATRLVEAAEGWGRDRGATVSETRTYHRGSLAVPFWQERMDYEERYVGLRKPLT